MARIRWPGWNSDESTRRTWPKTISHFSLNGVKGLLCFSVQLPVKRPAQSTCTLFPRSVEQDVDQTRPRLHGPYRLDNWSQYVTGSSANCRRMSRLCTPTQETGSSTASHLRVVGSGCKQAWCHFVIRAWTECLAHRSSGVPLLKPLFSFRLARDYASCSDYDGEYVDRIAGVAIHMKRIHGYM